MKNQITSIIERYRNNKAISSDDIAEIIMRQKNYFASMDSELILKKLDELEPKLQMIHHNSHVLNNLSKSFIKYKKLNDKKIEQFLIEINDQLEFMH